MNPADLIAALARYRLAHSDYMAMIREDVASLTLTNGRTRFAKACESLAEVVDRLDEEGALFISGGTVRVMVASEPVWEGHCASCGQKIEVRGENVSDAAS